jgi:beta-lactamase regulating signal transducer with metallopeptidase domain
VTVFHETARTLTEYMLNSMTGGLAIALFAGVVLRFCGRRSSSTRFAVWFSALIAIAALPWLHGFATVVASVRPETSLSAFTLPASWATAIFLGWALIASLGIIRVGLGVRQLRRLRAGSVAVDPATLDPRLQETLQEFSSRTVTLAVSDQLQVPAAIGFFKPLIVLPTWSLRELSVEELNSILIHELAHLRRWDDWTNLAQKVLRAVFFFHPAVWWVENQVSLEREMACDDIVLSQRVSPRSYAECLVSMAEKSFMRRGLAMAQAAVSRMRHTTQRVTQILDRNRSSATGVWKPALGLVSVFSVVCLVVAARTPEMIAFQDASSSFAAKSFSVKSVAANVEPVSGSAASAPVIAAKWIEPAAAPALSGSHAKRETTASTAPLRHKSPEVDTTRLNARAIQPRSIEAFLPANLELPPDNVAVQTVFVVMQSEGAGPNQGYWTLCVWRVTVRGNGDRAPVETIFPAKSI